MAKKKPRSEVRNRVRDIVGKGVEAYFGSEPEEGEGAEPLAEGTTSAAESSTPDEDAILEHYLEVEANAAGDVLTEERREAPPAEAPPAEEAPPGPEVTSPQPPTSDELGASTMEGGFTAPRPPVGEAPPLGEPAPDETITGYRPPGADVTPRRTYVGGIIPETPMGGITVTPPGQSSDTGIPEPAPAPVVDRDEIIRRVGPERFDELEREIDDLYDRAPTVLASKKDLADQVLLALREARELLWVTPERVVDAEYKVKQVRAIMRRYQLSAEWGNTYGLRILGYEVAWFVFFLATFFWALVARDGIMNWLSYWTGTSVTAPYLLLALPFWTNLVWGGIGGVVGALYSLWWHVSEVQDFDKQYAMWYLVQPIMGMILGGIVYLVISTGFLALQGQPVAADAGVATQLFPALIATLGGFRQKFVYELLERIIRVLTPRPQEG